MSRQKAIILYGPPGSGKSTQAALLAQRLDLVHLDTGKLIERGIYTTGELKEYKEDFESGKLVPSEVVVKIILKNVELIAQVGSGVVFSGSPRTLPEAEILMPDLVRLYGKENIHVFALEIPEEISTRRNSARLVCKECGAPVLTEYYNGIPKNCPICGGELYKRTLDNPEVMKERLHEYEEQTTPIFNYMGENGYDFMEIDGTPAPYKIFNVIYDHLKNT